MLTSLHSSFLQKLITLLAIVILTFQITGCEQPIETLLHKRDIPIQLADHRLQANDLQGIINQAITLIQETLPQAAYNGLVVFGNCSAFPKIEGRITLKFMQTEQGVWSVRTYMATASVYTMNQKMDIRIVSEPYLNYNPQHYDEANMDLILQSVARYIQEHNISNCTVELAKLEDSWNAKCIREEGKTWEKVCHFKIDATTGVIHEVQE